MWTLSEISEIGAINTKVLPNFTKREQPKKPRRETLKNKKKK